MFQVEVSYNASRLTVTPPGLQHHARHLSHGSQTILFNFTIISGSKLTDILTPPTSPGLGVSVPGANAGSNPAVT